MRSRNVSVSLAIVALLAIGLASFAKTGNAGGNSNPRVLPPNSKPGGHSYGEWSEKWWQWAFSFEADDFPLTDTAPCSAGQSGNVWFLGGTFTSEAEGKVERDCTVPTGKALFFPLINVECSTAEGNGDTEAELRECATGLLSPDDVPLLFCEVDGVALQNLGGYRTPSAGFTYSAPAGSILGNADPVTDSLSVGDGYYIMLPPLSAGTHTLHFGGTFTSFNNFKVEATYHLTVK